MFSVWKNKSLKLFTLFHSLSKYWYLFEEITQTQAYHRSNSHLINNNKKSCLYFLSKVDVHLGAAVTSRDHKSNCIIKLKLAYVHTW